MSVPAKSVRAVMTAAFLGFILSGMLYIAAPPRTTAQFLDSNGPAMLWGVVFLAGGVIAVAGVVKKLPHVERLGLMFIIIAGVVLTITQAFVMFSTPITWSRGGGTGIYASFTLLAFGSWLRLGKSVETVNLAADIEREWRGDDGS